MINTPAFESLMRYKKLQEAYYFFESSAGHWGYPIAYAWMRWHIVVAMQREEAFANANKEEWQKMEET